MTDQRVTYPEPTSEALQRRRLSIAGVVQGVGFRPFVYTLAVELGLAGFVGNDSSGVFVEIEGAPDLLDHFERRLWAEPPRLAHIERVTREIMPLAGDSAFVIEPSRRGPHAATLVSPDIAICDDCLAELRNPTDRRYRYPFINCTHCGPRFTIIQALPYDRPQTTMAAFVLCDQCQAEYENPRDRRFHAQPVACPACGPQLELHQAGAAPLLGDDALAAAQQLLAAGKIIAVKGLGGFHLACDASSDAAVQELRRRKGRVDKPFAVMVADLAAAQQAAQLTAAEIALLSGSERPIVLVRKQAASPLSRHVAPGNQAVGLMLPYTPLHHLLFDAGGDAAPPPFLVMTSGNFTDEPIAYDNADALQRLAPLADAFLLHNRDIVLPCDDSVVRLVAGRELPIRRSRGYAPFPVQLARQQPPTLAVGGELKCTFCLANGEHAFLSQHIGDMENWETLQTFERSVAHMQRLFDIEPQVIACDLHPGYLSTAWALEHAGDRRVVQVQHHHAHIAALLVEQQQKLTTPVIGVCFDGSGYGVDGAVWGGELLIADGRGFRRRSHLAYVPLPGGDAGVKHPSRMALAHLWAAGEPWQPQLAPVAAATPSEVAVLRRQFESGFRTVPTSSMGRLFDAVAALAGVRQRVTYEAQAAVELEALAEMAAEGSYSFDLAPDGSQFDAAPLIRAVVADLHRQTPVGVIAARFHRGVADLIVALCQGVAAEEGLTKVALSGGVFQNCTLLTLATSALEAGGFTVLTHQAVPPNDGGLSLGQAVIAGWQA